jgi:hypothetical protein
MSNTHQAATATAVAALALGLSIGAGTAPAQAAPTLSMSSHIDYHPTDPSNQYQVIHIQGMVTMSQAAAQDSINHGYTIELRYWGDDPSSDDLLAGPVDPKTVYAAADGLHFEHSLTMSRDLLDEDTPIIVDPDDRDEIYIGSRLLDSSGKTVSLVESNRIVKESF